MAIVLQQALLTLIMLSVATPAAAVRYTPPSVDQYLCNGTAVKHVDYPAVALLRRLRLGGSSASGLIEYGIGPDGPRERISLAYQLDSEPVTIVGGRGATRDNWVDLKFFGLLPGMHRLRLGTAFADGIGWDDKYCFRIGQARKE